VDVQAAHIPGGYDRSRPPFSSTRGTVMQRTRTVTTPVLAFVAVLSAAMLALAGCSTPAPEREPGSASGPPVPSSGSPTTASPEPTPSPSRSVLQEQAVAAGHPEAVSAGTGILERGGNAADAAIATAFAVAVVEPFASGIGGGGSALVARGQEPPVAYDYRETVSADGDVPASGTGVPGFVDGMATLHEEHGSMEWSELLAPAIRLADEGFPVSPLLAQRMRADYGPGAIEGLDHFHRASAPLDEGDTLVQAGLAATMETLAAEGPEALYTGSLAQGLTATGRIDAASLAGYETVASEPVGGSFGDYEFISAAPPLPGAAVVQLLQVAEALGVADAEPGSADYVDRMTAAWQVADASVQESFGDPAFVDVPVDRLTDAEANAGLARNEVASALSGPESGRDGGDGGETVQAAQPIEAGNTTHLTVVDDDGLTVSMTNTITSFWGGSDSADVGGFFLNNQLSRFESLDTPSNQPEPGRKSVSWSAPSLILDAEGRVVMGLGSPGGQAIPSILAGVAVPWALQDVPLQKAVETPRHYLQGGVLALEDQPSREVAALVRQRGWQTQVTQRADGIFGSVQALEIDYETGTITGATDSRREGDVAVVPAG
jgi:gamma-glutamyltranspeptidase / glutathione hydrolase